jgi:SAM-dependent methyltransferase
VTTCSICGGQQFREQKVLWPALIEEWGLKADEVDYVDRQQGCSCVSCGGNLRSIALGLALRRAFGTDQTLIEFVKSEAARHISVLEINEAYLLTSTLKNMAGHILGSFPEIDMMALPYADCSFDIVLHSDTLEHVPDPLKGLRESYRVLRAGGSLCFTIPIIAGRMTRSRAGLPPSYHGYPNKFSEEFRVHTEFGADFWAMVMQAGFDRLTIDTVEYPAATAVTATR